MYIYIYVTRQIMSQKWSLKKKSNPFPHNAQNYNWVVLFKKRWELQVDFNIPNKQNKFKFKHNVLPPLI